MQNELLHYIIGYGRQYMLPAESQALKQLSLTPEGKETYRKHASAVEIESLFGFNNPDALALVALGQVEAEKAIARRIYNEHQREILNLCPKCRQLARTPSARQCRHCGHDWH